MEDVFVLFDGSADSTPRQLTIAIREASSAHCELRVTVDPPLTGTLLLTVGCQRFGGSFDAQGTAAIRDIPVELLLSRPDQQFELTLLPG